MINFAELPATATNEPHTKRNLVRWTNDELDAVASRYIELCRAQGADPMQRTRFKQRVLQAQQVLPDARRRPPGVMGSSSSLMRLWQVVDNRVRLDAAQPQLQPSAPAQARTPWTQPAHAPLAQAPGPVHDGGHGTWHACMSAPAQHIEQPAARPDATLEAQVRALSARLASIFVDEAVRGLRDAFAREFPALQARAIAVSRTLPKILVVGPLAKQQPHLEKAVEGMADLKFVSSEEGAQLIKLRGSSCVYGLLWSNYASHPMQAALQRILPAERVRIVSGGIETLRDALEEVVLSLPDTHQVRDT